MTKKRDNRDLEGNTSPPNPSKKKQCVQGKKWVFTFNWYNEDQVERLEQCFKGDDVKEYIFQREMGESGNPHLQGYVEFKKRKRPSELNINFRWSLMHWEKAKGDRKSNLNYCSKSCLDIGPWGKWRYTNMRIPRKLKLITPDKPWQLDILRILESEPDDRTVHWYWSHEGGIGKTQFCKYLCGTRPEEISVLHGKGHDIRHGLADWIMKIGDFPWCVTYPIPRCFGKNYVSYEGLENIKDMFFYSGKYEGGQVNGPPPHLFVFANGPPDMSMLSKDRWNVVCIDPDYVDENGEKLVPPEFFGL